MAGLEAVVGSCITLSGEPGAERIDPCRLHAAMMGAAQGYTRSANLEADEREPGESVEACSQRGRSVMASRLSQMRLAEGTSAETIKVTVKVVWPSEVSLRIQM